MSDLLYAERDPMQLDEAGSYYTKHVIAMTAEGLHEKAEIAAELAYRDMLIDALIEQRDAVVNGIAEAFHGS